MYIICNNLDAQVSNRDWGLARFGSAKCAKNNWKMGNFALPIVSPGLYMAHGRKTIGKHGMLYNLNPFVISMVTIINFLFSRMNLGWYFGGLVYILPNKVSKITAFVYYIEHPGLFLYKTLSGIVVQHCHIFMWYKLQSISKYLSSLFTILVSK